MIQPELPELHLRGVWFVKEGLAISASIRFYKVISIYRDSDLTNLTPEIFEQTSSQTSILLFCKTRKNEQPSLQETDE